MEFLGLELWQVIVILIAGFWAGTINSVVGSGTLVTFPVLVSVGFPPVTAQMSNAIGLVAAGFSGTYGYRRELKEAKEVVPRLTVASLLGGVIGSALLMVLPEDVFGYAAPILLVVALTIVVLQPRLAKRVKKYRAEEDDEEEIPRAPVGFNLWFLVFLAGIYGGYFVAAQGVLLMGILGVLMSGTLVHSNAVKTWLALSVNLIAATGYILFAFDRIDWTAVILIAVSAMFGGTVGAVIGRRIKPAALRAVIVVVGLAGLTNMIYRLVVDA